MTAEMRARRVERLAELGSLLPIGDINLDQLKRFIFFHIGRERLLFDGTEEVFAEAANAYGHRGNWDYDPNPPPPLVVDLDAENLAVTAISYNCVRGMRLADSFELEAARDYDHVPEAGGHWSDAYYRAPRVNPAYSPVERTAKLQEWLECEWRDSWDDEE